MTDIDANRIDHMRSIHAKLNSTVPVEYHLTPTGDELLKQLPPGSLVINATGMGKDRPGSPLSNDAAWPAQALAWEFNYRGELSFLQQARTNATTIEDGWRYFIYGWTRVMAEVFHIDIPTQGPLFDQLYEAAAALR